MRDGDVKTAGAADSQRPRRKRSRYRHPRSPHGRRRRAPLFGALDLGTNNCRLLIAHPTRNDLRVVDAFSRIVRLGEGVSRSGALSEAAIDRAVSALKVCARKMRKRQVQKARCVATEACRIATNRDAFIDRVKEETGLDLEIISAEEEARLAVLGCQSLLDPAARQALVFDIGGGSTELIWVDLAKGAPMRVVGWVSMPFGVVSLTEKYADGGHPESSYGAMRSAVESHFLEFESLHRLTAAISQGSNVQFIGTSGTVTTLASLHLGLKVYDRRRVDGAWIDGGAMRTLAREVALMEMEERRAVPCIGRDRADLVVAGCAILETLLEQWPIDRMRVADRGIREGILRSLMARGLARELVFDPAASEPE